MLEACGYSTQDIERFVSEGMQFKLVVFSAGHTALLATWDNIAAIASEVYPDLAQDLYVQAKVLRSMPYSELQELAGYDFAKVAARGPEDEQFMTYERYKRSKRTAAHTRAFYEHTLHMRRLFSGDGFTYDERGNRGVQEYCSLNVPLRTLSGSELTDITVQN